jgi:preprotein translocase subunit SecF
MTNMSKRKNKKLFKKIVSVSPLYFLIVGAVFLVISISALRSNNEHMLTLRTAVYTADKNNKDVSAALQALQAYVTRHMNTDLSTGNGSVYPPIQLKYTYQRLLNTESAQAAANNTQIYTDAENSCQSQISGGFSGRTRVPCIEQYVQTHDLQLPQIPTALYEFDFVSPAWSPDLAGWSLFAMIIAFALAVINLFHKFVYKRYIDK